MKGDEMESTMNAEQERERMREEAEEARRGKLLAEWLGLPVCREHPDRWETAIGTKTALGLYRTVKRAIDEGK